MAVKVVGQIVGPSATGYADLPPYPYDPEKAKALIAAAKADGVNVAEPIDGDCPRGLILRANEVVQFIAKSLKSIGMTGVTSETQEIGAFEQQWTMGLQEHPARARAARPAAARSGADGLLRQRRQLLRLRGQHLGVLRPRAGEDVHGRDRHDW